MLEKFGDIHQTAVSLLPQLLFDRNNNVHRLVMSIYASIIEQSGEALTLLSLNNAGTFDIILRSTLEAYVDLINLCDDSAYLDNMQASYHEQWLKLARDGADGQNPFLVPFATPEASAKIQFHEAALEELRARKRGPLNHAQRFNMAKLGEMYYSVYNSLCAEAHNNIRALTRRHFRLSEHGQPQLVIFEGPSENSLASIVTYMQIITFGTRLVHAYFGSQAQEAITDMEEELSAAIIQAEAAED